MRNRSPSFNRFFAFFVLTFMCTLGALAEPDASSEAANDEVSNVNAYNPTLAEVRPSGYDPFAGQPFFLLSDASYGSDQEALVRLEAPGLFFKEELQEYAGADILVYRVPRPLEFLKAQKNLHRIVLKPNYTGEGLSNTMSYLWDSWSRQARRSWQRVLSFSTRDKALESAPEFKMGDTIEAPTSFSRQPQYAPMKGFELVDRFRYPLWDAIPISSAKDVKVSGSSSDWMPKNPGNVMVPLGRLPVGLYVVEALIGKYRATTLLFVSNTVVVTKNTSQGMMAWTADRKTGKPVEGASIKWFDGLGVLASGATQADGIVTLQHVAPERSYVIGSDTKGSVFISENFYYDSEIYNTKVFAFTDRPLYRPGDEVNIKFVGRNFKNATDSSVASAGDIQLQVIDPNGVQIVNTKTRLASDTGGEATVVLPSNAAAGGYTLRFDYNGNTYGSAFRVAEYIKPHFDVNLVWAKPSFNTGEKIEGKISLRYPDGRPVKAAKVSVSLRAQQTTLVAGELRYAGLFPVSLTEEELLTDEQGDVKLSLPAALNPSRYAITVFAKDSAAYRVKVTRELLIGRSATSYALSAAATFSEVGQSVLFQLKPQAPIESVKSASAIPGSWDLVRLEDGSHQSGTLVGSKGGVTQFSIKFDRAGSYTLRVLDKQSNLLAATSHWIAGEGLQTIPGNIEVVFDRSHYSIGETAQALITFPMPVDEALLTLERDRVEKHALLSQGADWVTLERVTPSQYRAHIKVDSHFAPNLTFSVLYVNQGEMVFQNAGIVVATPTLDLTIHADKPVYAPGETVTLDITSRLGDKPVPANLTVSVVDELIYVLQPEIAPSIVDFFYHPRRNSVRTTSSQSFINYDFARTPDLASARGGAYGRQHERAVKVLERPRRDEKDTAAWQATLQTGSDGHAQMTFKMPDSLARWRITVRGLSVVGKTDGLVGQRTASIRSEKALYLKWTGPQRFRAHDKPSLQMVAFNQTDQEKVVDWVISGAGLKLTQKVTLKRGANYLQVKASALEAGELTAELIQDGETMDQVRTSIVVDPENWMADHEAVVALNASQDKVIPLTLPQDAKDISVRIVGSLSSQMAKLADDLMAYPLGGVEPTASRIIPLTLVANSLVQTGKLSTDNDARDTQSVMAMLRTHRQRLALLAGINGRFGWWGALEDDSALLTAYAYYADWLASRSLGLGISSENIKPVLVAYKERSGQEPLLHRALSLWLAREMGLQITTQLTGLASDLDNGANLKTTADPKARQSLVFASPNSSVAYKIAVTLVVDMMRQLKQPLPPRLDTAKQQIRDDLSHLSSPLVQSLLAMTSQKPGNDLSALLTEASADSPTIDRALTLVWLQKASMNTSAFGARELTTETQLKTQPQAWGVKQTATGQAVYTWTGPSIPAQLELGSLSSSVDRESLVLSYRSREKDRSTLPVTVSRKLYRLVPATYEKQSKDDVITDGIVAFKVESVKPGEHLNGNTLYVDEIRLSADQGQYHFGMVQAPLPPGSEVEPATWGLQLSGFDDEPNPKKDQSKEDNAQASASSSSSLARFTMAEMGTLAYYQPIPLLKGKLVLRQLVRFSMPGQFEIPPVRFFGLYQSADKALQDKGEKPTYSLTVE